MKNLSAVTRLEIRYQDLDPYGHVNNNAVYLQFFESIRFACWCALAALLSINELEAGDVPGVRCVIAETSVRHKVPIFFADTLRATASIPTVGNHSYTMGFELRTGETLEEGLVVAEGYAAQVYFEPKTNEVIPCPDWLLPAVAKLEGRPEGSCIPQDR